MGFHSSFSAADEAGKAKADEEKKMENLSLQYSNPSPRLTPTIKGLTTEWKIDFRDALRLIDTKT